MKKLLINTFYLLLMAWVLVSAINKPNSGGAPAASTGAPGEQTCAMSTCHDDNSLNAGPALLNLTIPAVISPGAEVPIEVSLAETGKVRFGFQLTVLDDKGNACGEILLVDSTRTQILQGNSAFPDRSYLTYTFNGTMTKSGSIGWNGTWKAPDKTGNYTFYVAGISANNDGTDKGDFAYTFSKRITVGALNVSKTSKHTISVSKNSEGLILTNPSGSKIDKILVTDLNGRVIFADSKSFYDKIRSVSFDENFTGIAIVTVYTHSETISQKLFITHD
jgi:hypothetical protein